MAIEIPPKYSPDSSFELFWLECKTRIGRGSSRDAYEIPNTEKILKVANGQSNFANWCEIVIHSYKKETGQLAEIFSWSKSGKFLVMERLKPIQNPAELASFNFPDYLTDRKPENYGRDSSGNIKALDYAALVFHENSIFSASQFTSAT